MEIFLFAAGLFYGLWPHPYLLCFVLGECFLSKRLYGLLFFTAGIFYALLHQFFCIDALPEKKPVIPVAHVKGEVVRVVHQDVYKARFYFRLSEYNHKKNKALLYLSWYQKPPRLFNGQRLELKVKLKKARNYQNPGHFDFKRFLLANHVEWTGYVKQDLSLPSEPTALHNLRSFLARSVEKKIENSRDAGLIKALSLGFSNGLEADSWELFKRTGTIHLMVISGAHVGLVAMMFFYIIKWLWSCSTFLCLHCPAQRAAALGSFFTATAYALLAGFGLPAQRALIFCFFWSFRYLGRRAYSSWQIWRYALLIVLLSEPHALILPGFYLSFLAVAAIIAVIQRFGGRGWLNALKIQAACLLALSPLSLYWFSYSSVNGFFANLLAVPFVGMILLPLALLAVLLSLFHGFDIFYKCLELLIHYFLGFLKSIDKLQAINFEFHIYHLNVLLSIAVIFLLLYCLPLRPYRGIVALLLLLICFPPADKVSEGQVKIDVLDVGQGLAVVVRTSRHVLIYDTGDKFYQGTDMGKMVVLPYLEQMGVHQVDSIVISHPDKDHRGGLASIQKGIKAEKVFINDKRYLKHAESCQKEAAWQWDGIHFRFFPIRKRFKEKNNRSCVLQISNGRYKMLLTGDIEARAEEYLINHYSTALQSDLLLVPHHGSKTSSSPGFLNTVKPKYAIASLGFDNRFHFPHAQVLKRYQLQGISFLTTENMGMIRLMMTADSMHFEFYHEPKQK